ncbi:hypothetical protein B0I35DRAFT_455331 [Stachybotrys elegans]|uniref:Clr5 domain-containing protein n=1 Tax=Stachybotrys elegans TaxID=80388 RepID=A0A8K0S809_9HYPO|nr:hypothetical protein B0I35DRAFT_455331 [Stachybotrys elegans]
MVHRGPRHNGITPGPMPEEWERMKNHIYQIYILEGHTLKDMILRMETDHGFKATEKMYNTFFKKLRPLFNKNKRAKSELQGRDGVKIPRTRPRRLQGHGQNTSRQQPYRRILPCLSFNPQMCDGYANQMVVLNPTEVYVHRLFDTFDFSSSHFDIIVPPGVPDNSSVWQQTSDGMVCERLKNILGNNDSAMIIKFWRICRRLYETGLQLGNYLILQSFLQYIQRLAAIRYPENHPVRGLLRVLCKIPIHEFSETLEIGYLRTITCLQSRVGFGNAIKYNRQAPSTDEILSRYRRVLEMAQQSFTLTETRTIEILHGYTYAAYCNANDFALTWNLAFDLVNRVESMGFVSDHRKWCHLLCILSRSTGHGKQGHDILKLAIWKLERGDRECQTRAVMLAGVLAAETEYPPDTCIGIFDCRCGKHCN